MHRCTECRKTGDLVRCGTCTQWLHGRCVKGGTQCKSCEAAEHVVEECAQSNCGAAACSQQCKLCNRKMCELHSLGDAIDHQRACAQCVVHVMAAVSDHNAVRCVAVATRSSAGGRQLDELPATHMAKGEAGRQQRRQWVEQQDREPVQQGLASEQLQRLVVARPFVGKPNQGSVTMEADDSDDSDEEEERAAAKKRQQQAKADAEDAAKLGADSEGLQYLEQLLVQGRAVAAGLQKGLAEMQ